MHISKLELKGFKSFANKTTVHLSNGITAVVGPNGCGKSNIVDALRWVLGEQRASQLRSSAMASVIFNGNKDRKKAGFAEVSLTIDNNKGILPSEFEEVTLTRRLFRSGQSEYLLNGTACRLKDIHALFVDTGLSTNAYSVIELKAVEGIVDDRNNERRKLFEEAAGVTRYKEQRKDTHKKLNECREDLQRLGDILLILDKKVKSLETQSRKARQLKDLQKELLDLDQIAAVFEHQSLESELKPLKDRQQNAEKERVKIEEQLSHLEKHLNASRESSSESLDAEDKAHQEYVRLQEQYSALQTSLKVSQQQLSNLKERIVQLKTEKDQAVERMDEVQSLLGHTDENARRIEASYLQLEQQLQKVQKEYESALNAFNEHRRTFELKEKEVSRIRQKVTSLRESRIRQQVALEQKQQQLNQWKDDASDYDERIAQLKSEIIDHKKEVERFEGQKNESDERYIWLEEQVEALQEEKEQLQQKLNSLKSSLQSSQAELKMLKHLESSSAYTKEQIKEILNQREKIGLAELSTFAQHIESSEELAPYVEIALGSYADTLIVQDLEEVKKLTHYAKTNKLGRLPFFVKSHSTETKVLPNSLYEELQFPEELSALAKTFFGGIIVSDTELEKGDRNLPDGYSSVIFKDGTQVLANGILQAGELEEHAGQRIGLKARIKDSEQRIEKLEGELQDLMLQLQLKQTQLEELKTQRQIAKERLKQVIELWQNVQQKLRRSELELDSVKTAKERGNDRFKKANAEIEHLSKDVQSQAETLLEAEEELQERELNTEADRDEMRLLEEQKNVAQKLLSETKLKNQDITNQRQNLTKDADRSRQTLHSLQSAISEKTEQLALNEDRIAQLNGEVESLQETVEKARGEVNEALEKLKVLKQENAGFRGAIRQLEDDIRDQQRKKELNKDFIHHLSMAQQSLESQLKQLSDRVWEDYNKLLRQLEVVIPEHFNLEQAKSRLKIVRQKIQQIGQVNELAIEEYETEKENLDFYLKQIDDLHKAESQLLESLEEINKTAEDRFNTTFAEIRTNFIQVFKTLFDQDDECDLLIDEEAEDVLEAQIKIMARPKGKRPSSISQLSGGEKTLTATALLFAIYLVKPSPFCVLDEVDAPLDDANIERFANMIKRFSTETQFIIVTHNKNTMANAERLYGVTMVESGISQLVSVDVSGLEVE